MLVKAFAKLNLCLEVLGRRSDGYHEIRTVMQTIDLADDVEIAPFDSLRVRCGDPDLEGGNNLAWKAAVEMADSCGRLPLVDISITKRIPVGMGLGGGSSDAAAVVLALNRLWRLEYPTMKLAEIAARLGSDVPFFVYGGAALASGRGHLIDPLPTRSGLGATLVCPAHEVEAKTAAMYGKLTQQCFSDGGITHRVVQGIMMGQFSPDLFYNAFEDVAVREFTQLEEIRASIERTTGRRPHLTGAGPGLFLFPSTPQEKDLVARALQPWGAGAYFVRTLGRNVQTFCLGEGDP